MTKIFLKQLHIENLILVSKASVEFERGFTVISGETGSGKSSLLYALKLALGERGDVDKIREGAEKGKVTALFEVEGPFPALRELGIEIEDTLLISREITKSGKTRAFVNHEPVQVSLLKEIGKFLISTLDQGSSLQMKDEKQQLHFLDVAAKNGTLLQELSLKKAHLATVRKEYAELEKLSVEREREKAILEKERDEIVRVGMQPGEEEQLFQEFRLLTTAEERRELLKKCHHALQSAQQALHPRLREAEKLKELDPHLAADLEEFPNVLLQCNEIRLSIERSLGTLEVSEERLATLHERLSSFDKLKRRFGPTFEDVFSTLQEIENRLKLLEGLDGTIEEAADRKGQLEQAVAALQATLTERRKKTIPGFESAVEALLEELNFPQVDFEVHLEGDEKCSFWMAPNIGEKSVAVSSGISGGEMARLLLALLILLSAEEGRVVLLFDEMDAHIGGTTGAKIGQKLKSLAKDGQVIAITHFPQVAEAADHHIAIGKRVEGERTVALMTQLKKPQRLHELARMAGETVG